MLWILRRIMMVVIRLKIVMLKSNYRKMKLLPKNETTLISLRRETRSSQVPSSHFTPPKVQPPISRDDEFSTSKKPSSRVSLNHPKSNIIGDFDEGHCLRRGPSYSANCWYHILSTIDLHAGPRKIQKYYFPSMGPREHLEWHGATRSDTGAIKVPLLAKMTKMPIVNLGLAESQTRSKSPQNSTFHSFTSKLRFLEIFGNFDQVWLGVDSWWAPKILILIWPSERVEPNAIAKIIKFSFQRLLIGRKSELKQLRYHENRLMHQSMHH